MPAEHIKPVMKINKLAWFPGRLEPTSLAIGTSKTLAMVWLMNVDII